MIRIYARKTAFDADVIEVHEDKLVTYQMRYGSKYNCKDKDKTRFNEDMLPKIGYRLEATIC